MALSMLATGFVGGYFAATERGKVQTAMALALAEKEYAQHNERVVDGWNSAVGVLRTRIRDGYRPAIPLPATPPQADPAGGTDGRSPDPLPPARELEAALETCRAERDKLIQDGALTTIQLRSLQDWAVPKGN